MPEHSHMWFVRRGATVKGPFAGAAIRRFIVLGRVRDSDEVSPDQGEWTAVGRHPAFSEDAALAVSGAHPELAREDERSGRDRRHDAVGMTAERRAGEDRRSAEAPLELERRRRRLESFASARPEPQNLRQPVLLVALLLTILVGAGVLLSRDRQQQLQPDCAAAPKPGVVWRGCELDARVLGAVDLSAADLDSVHAPGADFRTARLASTRLRYADLTRADFRASTLDGAILTGAMLRFAQLEGANLRNADLSYADLRSASLQGASLDGARFDDAYWVDGRRCGRESVGQCR